MDFVGMDLLGPLRKTTRGNEYLLVITDRFSKYTKTVPLSSIKVQPVAKAFCDHWVYDFGPPRYVLSDNGKQFASKFFVAVCNTLRIRNLVTSAYHPQTNGQTERFNRTILAGLRHFIAEDQRDWDEFSGALTYAYNTTVHRSTGLAPVYLVLTRPPTSLLVKEATPVEFDRITPQNTQQRFLACLEKLMATAMPRLQQAQARYKADFDKSIREINQNLRPGAWVFLERETKVRDADGKATEGKLYPKALGPYNILEARTHVVILQMEGLREVASLDRVTPAPLPLGVEVTAPPLPDVVETSPEIGIDLTGPVDTPVSSPIPDSPDEITPVPPTRPFSRFKRAPPREAVYDHVVSHDRNEDIA